LRFIIKELKAKTAIPRNPREEKKEGFYLKKNSVYCPADIAMLRKGEMTVADITYLQCTCPLYWSKKIRQRYFLCPANHPKFFSQKGCNYLIRLTRSKEEEIDYGSKELYNFVGWGMMNSPHLDFEMLFKKVNEPNLLSIMASGHKKSCDEEVIEISSF